MSDDGAGLGVGADRALKTVLGGDPQPSADERRTPAQLRLHIEQHRGTSGYEETANEAAWRVLLTYEKRPETVAWPAEPEYEYEDLVARTGFHAVGPDLYATVKEETDGIGDLTLSDLGLTGFQWGWAVNAAKYIVGAPPVANPAIIEVG